MPQNDGNPPRNPSGTAAADDACPKCGVEMESIESGVDSLAMHQLRLCPGCYLVTWCDPEGIHLRQGVPMKNGVDARRVATWFAGEPQKC